jgi:hypothetical protein
MLTLLQVAYKVPWTAISSLLGQFSVQFNQPAILLWLNLAYFLPSVPALLLHSSLQDRLEQRLGLPRAAMARWGVGICRGRQQQQQQQKQRCQPL